MMETLIGVGIGGAIGVAATISREFMQSRRQREIQLRKEVLPIAARALAAAQEAWDSSSEFHSTTTGLQQKMRLQNSNTKARNQLLIALNELALLIPDIRDETLALLDSVSLYSETLAKHHDQRLDDYLDAGTALSERVQKVLKTKNKSV